MRISDWSSDVCSSDLLRARQAVLDVGDHRLDLALPLLGGMIFGIFRQVAMRARFLDRFHDRGTFNRPQTMKLLRQPSVALSEHWHLFDRSHLNPFVRNRQNCPPPQPGAHIRSEEHTSEIQSLMRKSYPVFTLKKK